MKGGGSRGRGKEEGMGRKGKVMEGPVCIYKLSVEYPMSILYLASPCIKPTSFRGLNTVTPIHAVLFSDAGNSL